MPDDFKGNYYNIFGNAYKFMQKHYNATTDADFEAIVREIGQMETDFEKEMAWAIASEIERRFMERQA